MDLAVPTAAAIKLAGAGAVPMQRNQISHTAPSPPRRKSAPAAVEDLRAVLQQGSAALTRGSAARHVRLRGRAPRGESAQRTLVMVPAASRAVL